MSGTLIRPLPWARGPVCLWRMGSLGVGAVRAQYECGKVCLSLLNTWAGRNSEVWDPTSSTILQARPPARLHVSGVCSLQAWQWGWR